MADNYRPEAKSRIKPLRDTINGPRFRQAALVFMNRAAQRGKAARAKEAQKAA